ncbi:MAG: elongation factor P maturation arginine rhamnosyltransferase EarP [Burkholderiaceae bacterium]|nr:elongation factor P maturation arginine rhamnosyltransferase EarP [Roseateles sp.]MBV8471078.1 elongation factor P maturation arginine rhamnosyltransferase EarP [Burkholderiaceae bacterium]
MRNKTWDVFCQVIDNHGDIGVCWRLGRDLAARGQAVRLWLDDASALRWMAPEPWPAGLSVHRWADAASQFQSADVVIEAFGCNLPDEVLARMAQAPHAPCWINLEYLSAEAYVERSHLLKSPQFNGPAQGLNKHFFYPGFTPRTGGLIRESNLARRQSEFQAQAWSLAHQCASAPEERRVTLFAYQVHALPQLLQALADRPSVILVCSGAVQAEARQMIENRRASGAAVRAVALPYLPQDDFDHLLWSSDLNLVRGEDSFVRAQWAAKPMVWQIYPQSDMAHRTKLEAFLAHWLAAGAEPDMVADWRRLWLGWNGFEDLQAGPPWRLPDAAQALLHAKKWREHLSLQTDLSTQLLHFLGISG